jgi:hypothetical protein
MQTASHILMIRPSRFAFNPETAGSNHFQQHIGGLTAEEVLAQALEEFDGFVRILESKGINVLVIGDTELPVKPDAIFPNNWISFHEDGTVVLYPMAAENRRAERRTDIVDNLRKSFHITQLLDMSPYEADGRFLEGTGSIVFDHQNTIAYASLSPRTNKELFLLLASYLKYEPLFFHSYDESADAIYHTNVMMSIGERFVVICADAITEAREKENVLTSLRSGGREIIDISFQQMSCFAGNMLSLKATNGKDILVLSQSACDSLTEKQRTKLSQYTELVPVPIPTIETIGGGSARCMIALLR